jgi:hypothetical protein
LTRRDFSPATVPAGNVAPLASAPSLIGAPKLSGPFHVFFTTEPANGNVMADGSGDGAANAMGSGNGNSGNGNGNSGNGNNGNAGGNGKGNGKH